MIERSIATPADSVLKGKIVEGSALEPIPGATVVLENQGLGVSTDENGEFEFMELEEGVYTLIVSSVGFKTVTLEVDFPLENHLLIEMEIETIQSDDVIVTSSPIGRNIQYQPAQSINAEKLQQKAAPSLGEILDGTPGVTTRSFGSAPARPVIRGFDGDRVLVMQNGERMGDLSGTAVDHAVALDPLAMDRVEVIRGPASLLYGSSAIGGVVNMFSNDLPREWESGTSSSIATHISTMNKMGAGLLRSQYGTDRFAVTGRLIYRDGGDLRTPDGRLPDTAIQNISFGGGAGYRAGDFETGLSISGMDYTYGLPEAIEDPNESIEIRMNRTNIQSISTLKMDRFFDHAEFRLHLSDYQHDEFEIERMGSETTEDIGISFAQQSLSSSLVLRHRPVGKLEGAAGLSFNYSEIEVGGEEALTPNANGYFIAGYLYEELSLTQTLTLKAGTRLEFKETFVTTNDLFTNADDFEDRSDLIFSGALGLNYSPSSSWTAGLQFARAYRTPTIEELYSFAPHAAAGSFDIGNASLNNEFSLGTDAFVEYLSNRISGQLSLFANRIDHFVDFSPTGDTHQPSGLPVFEYRSKEALMYGFEFTTDVRLSNNWIAGLGFDYVRGRERSGNRENLTFIPPFRTSAEVMYDNGSFYAGPRIRVVNKQEKTAPNEEPTDGYILLGADTGYRFGQGLTLSLRLDNLLNERYRDHLSRVENRNAPMPGQNLNVMMRWEF
ncbi:TonB-dependent receptor [Rhodohalobacter halophilus]|uniref:TonB-dependent receptor n=1 Tax=Rhodohalobacter halophilus TaxID=1812810 RepID=UPI0015B4EDAF|nr:TonB-dependent receptor [Rhodohalobacter halophilus]